MTEIKKVPKKNEIYSSFPPRFVPEPARTEPICDAQVTPFVPNDRPSPSDIIKTRLGHVNDGK